MTALAQDRSATQLERIVVEGGGLVEDAIDCTDLVSFADCTVSRLSGGERQCAWVAMGLAQNARCLLLDKPTSTLDLSHQPAIVFMVQALGRDKGMTVIVVLHDINLATRYCGLSIC